MRVAEGGEEGAELVEREFAARLTGAGVEFRHHGVELIDGGGIRHGKNSIEGERG
jgi:hypothetical protein